MTIRNRFVRSLSLANLRRLMYLYWYIEDIMDKVPFLRKCYISYWLEDEYYRRNLIHRFYKMMKAGRLINSGYIIDQGRFWLKYKDRQQHDTWFADIDGKEVWVEND